MKFVSFVRMGRVGFGAVRNSEVVNLTGKLKPGVRSLKRALADDLLGEAESYCANRSADFALSDITFLPVIPDPGKILCVGLNYQKHREETGRSPTDHPSMFVRFPDSQIGHRQSLIKPNVSDHFDYEGELAITIGRGGRNIAEGEALSHVAGYSCYNEGSIRDWQKHTIQFTPGKTFSGTGAFGPYLVTPDEVGDYSQLPIETRLNGEVMQKAELSDLIFSIPQIINYASTFTPLVAGDVIVTGTPGGVGFKREPPVYLKAGDIVEVDCGKVGTLVNGVVDENAL
ncbi:MAG: fumarylacetoacetate hydrolase family protein [Pseudomonadota bacterium]